MLNVLLGSLLPEGDPTKDKAVRQQYGRFCGMVGVVANLVLFGGKFLAGFLTGSIAITADAFNNLSDAGASIVTIVGFYLAGTKADADHPFGHGRMEYLAGLVVSFLILLMGFELGKLSVANILHPQAMVFSTLSLGILLLSILVKLGIGLFQRQMGKKIQSSALSATAVDSFSDAVATTAVLIGTLVGHWTDWYVDPWLGIVVTVLILKAGLQAAKDTLDPLLGQPPDKALVAQLEALMLSYPQVAGVHDLIIHDYGPNRTMMTVHAEVSVDADMLVVHDIIDRIERKISQQFSIDASIHVDPIATDDQHTLTLKARLEQILVDIDPTLSLHDFRITPGTYHTNLIFDLAVPSHFPMTDEAVEAAIQEQVAAIGGGTYHTVICIDHVLF